MYITHRHETNKMVREKDMHITRKQETHEQHLESERSVTVVSGFLDRYGPVQAPETQ